jgi:hypothetical protein
VRAAKASDAELGACVTRAWRLQAPDKLKAGHDERPASKQQKFKKTESRTAKRSRANRSG